MDRNNVIYSTIFTAIISFILLFILAMVYDFAKDRIAINKEKVRLTSVLDALGIKYENDIKDIQDKYSQVSVSYVKKEGDDFKSVTKEEFDSAKAKNDFSEIYSTEVDSQKIIAKPFKGGGLWGKIYGVLAFDDSVNTIKGFQITAQAETPGLGARIVEDFFRNQFSGEKIKDDKIKFLAPGLAEKTNKDDGVLDAISGATRTSEFIQKIVNNEIHDMKKIVNVLGGK